MNCFKISHLVSLKEDVPVGVPQHFVAHHCTFQHEQGSLKTIEFLLVRRWVCLVFIFGTVGSGSLLFAQIGGANPTVADSSPARASTAGLDAPQRRLKAAAELREEEHQRILGVMPNFNTSNVKDAERLSPGQKFELAAKAALDPFAFAVASVDAGISQAENDFPGYRQGGQGYARRFGASYADSFDSAMIGNALFPILLRQDPRYFRKATGSFTSRLWYAVMSTVKCKNDNGGWAPNYSNVLGNIAAGGISNLYYPSADRGAGLLFERAATVTAEGAIGAAFLEFWPDISRRMFAAHSRSRSPFNNN